MFHVTRKSILPAYGVLAALLFVATSSAKADDSITFIGAGNSAAVTISVFGGLGESTSAGDYNFYVNNSHAPIVAFCTDVFDSISSGEQWTAKKGLMFDLVPSTSYRYPGAMNIAAVDYIAQNYTPKPNAPTPSAAAAQLAIWDLMAGGQVTFSGGVYEWNKTAFQVTAGFASSTQSEQVNLASVFAIEHSALSIPGLGNAGTTSSGATFWQPVTWGTNGRPQDLITATAGVPEPSAIVLLSSLGAAGAFFGVRRMRRRPSK
jgi:hypothetical protein